MEYDCVILQRVYDEDVSEEATTHEQNNTDDQVILQMSMNIQIVKFHTNI